MSRGIRVSLLGLGVLGTLVAIDLLLGNQVRVEGTLVIAPLVVALFGLPRVTVIVALVAVILVILLGSSQQVLLENLIAKASLVALGGAIAVALSVRQQQAHLRAERVTLLDRVSRVSDTQAPLEEVVEALFEVILEDFADGCTIQVETETGLRTLSEAGLPRSGQPERLPGAQLGTEDNDTVTLPLTARDRFLGVLELRRRDSGFSETDALTATDIGRRSGQVLDNAGLFDDLDSLARRLDTVISLLDEGVYLFNPHGQLLFVNDAGCRCVGVDPAAEDKDVQVKEAAHLYGVELEAGGGFRTLAEGVANATVNGLSWEGVFRMWHLETGEHRWMLGKIRHIKSARDELLWSIMTVEDVTELKRQEIQEKMLAEISVGETSAAFDDLLQRFADATVPLFADSCWIYLPTANGVLDAPAMAHRDPEALDAMRELNDRFPVHLDQQLRTVEAQQRGTSAVFEIDAELLREASPSEAAFELMERIGNRSGMVVPLRDGEGVIGVMALGNNVGSRRFTEPDQEIAETIGQRCAEVIRHERESRENAEVARLLEFGLRPDDLPAIPGVEIAEFFEASSEFSQIGGDFYEGFESEHYWNILIGDVVGKGSAAATLNIEARDTLRVALRLTENPTLAFSELDRRLRQRQRNEQVTAALIRIEKARPDRILAVSAGHPLPLLRDSESIRELGLSGPILGLGINQEWPETATDWEPGSTLAVYTDGLSECRSNGDLFGLEGISQAMAVGRAPAEVAQAFEQALGEFRGAGQDPHRDDAAAIILTRCPSDRLGVNSGS